MCCGVLYRGMLGEVMIDTRHWSRCVKHCDAAVNNNNNVEKVTEDTNDEVPMTVESLIESELRKLNNDAHKTESAAGDNDDHETDLKQVVSDKISGEHEHHDEGFCDKSSTLTGPSSPESASLVMLEESLMVE